MNQQRFPKGKPTRVRSTQRVAAHRRSILFPLALCAILFGNPSNSQSPESSPETPSPPSYPDLHRPDLGSGTSTGSDTDEPILRDDPWWVAPLRRHIARIDESLDGDLGVYVKRLSDGGVLEYGSDRRWYLASTLKVPVNLVVFEQVEAGKLSLDREVELRPTDFVDGAGDLQWQAPGQRFTIAQLIEKSLENSDSIATDMLIRVVGLDRINQRLRAWTAGGIGPITTLLQVRYDAYGVLHPRVASLSNQALLNVRAAGTGEARLSALAQALGLERSALPADDLESVFERYYDKGLNSGRLDAFGALLERLATHRILRPDHTTRLLEHMQRISTGKNRIEAALPPGVPFAQKTGTQIARACNVGVVHPHQPAQSVVVVACSAHHREIVDAERAFQALGRALTTVGLVEQPTRSLSREENPNARSEPEAAQ